MIQTIKQVTDSQSCMKDKVTTLKTINFKSFFCMLVLLVMSCLVHEINEEGLCVSSFCLMCHYSAQMPTVQLTQTL